MKKLYTLLSAVLLAATAFATDITFTFNSAEGLNALGIAVPAEAAATDLGGTSVKNGVVTMTAVNGGTATRVWNSKTEGFSLRIYKDGSITFTTSAGSITAITVTAANANNFQLATAMGTLTLQDATTYQWTGSATSVTLQHTEAKNAQVATVTVTVSDGGVPVEPVEPVEPEPVEPVGTQLASLAGLYDLADGTEFQFTGSAYVTYQWGQYLYIMDLDEEGYAYSGLIYGSIDKEYNEGAVLPAGWKGTKTTYNGLTEISKVTGLQDATEMVEEDYYAAFDAYLADVANLDYGYENFRVIFSGVTLSEPDTKGNFSITATEEIADEEGNASEVTTTIPCFNKFGIDLPEGVSGKTYTLEGMVTIYKGEAEIYPIAWEDELGEPLWKIWYMGEDGDEVQVGEPLYVIKATQAEDGNLVYVTDNATQVYYDIYEDWGIEGEWYEWTPDFMALDCGTDTEMFNALSKMTVLAPGSVKGTLQDNYTNPRIELSQLPEQTEDAEMPEIHFDSYNAASPVYVNGNSITYVTGFYTVEDGTPYLYNPEPDEEVAGQRFAIDFRYAPALKGQMQEGHEYNMLAIWKQYEAFEPEDYNYDDEDFNWDDIDWGDEVKAARKAPRRIKASDANYYENLFICPISDLTDAINSNERIQAKTADTRIFNLAGQRTQRLQRGVNIIVSGGKAIKVAQ